MVMLTVSAVVILLMWHCLKLLGFTVIANQIALGTR